MKLFRELIQPTCNTCLLTCLAMITGRSVRYVRKVFKGKGIPTPTVAQTIPFLVEHGVYLALWIDMGREKLRVKDKLILTLNIKNRPALLVVYINDTVTHAVIWDGKRVLDPDGDLKKPKRLSSYKVIEYWPIILSDKIYNKLIKGRKK
uniref:Peptidase C39 domain-containing protein n=1 Tax=viral metagenome TaxID=1070528 RepID=A0A6H1ZVN5_9ZZZZ